LTLNLKLSLEYYKKNIVVKNDKFKIIINDCNEEQIKMFIKGNYYYCENPICSDDCPISNGAAICVKNSTKNINDININSCICNKGWKGDKCQLMDFTNFK